MPRFQACSNAILDLADRTKRGEKVTRGLKKLMLKGVNTTGVVCTAVIVKKGARAWISFGFCKETTSLSSVIELPNLPFHSYDFSNDFRSGRLSIAYAFACVCSDIITSAWAKTLKKKRHSHRCGEFNRTCENIS
jgi:hypothetical protein